MNNLFIAYDLFRPGQNYEAVRAKIEALGTWSKVQQSLYYVHTALTPQQAQARIAPALDANDKLVVIDAKGANVVGYSDQWINAVNGVWFNRAA